MNTETPDLLVKQWNANHETIYHIQKQDLIWNLQSQSLVQYEFLNMGGTLCLVASATELGASMGISPTTLFLSLWGSIPAGKAKDFVQQLIELKTNRKKQRLFFGADEFHFLPGIPESEVELVESIKDMGFQTSQVSDYTGSLKSISVSQYIQDAISSSNNLNLILRKLETPRDEQDLLRFLTTEFPGRWPREFQIWKARNDTQRSWWMNLYENKNNIVGFARLSLRGLSDSTLAWSPGALRLPIAENNSWHKSDGSLGPIGISKSLRGKGAGKVLLGLVLQALRQNEADRICIDWTNAFKYYEPLGFARSRNYLSAWRTDPQ